MLFFMQKKSVTGRFWSLWVGLQDWYVRSKLQVRPKSSRSKTALDFMRPHYMKKIEKKMQKKNDKKQWKKSLKKKKRTSRSKNPGAWSLKLGAWTLKLIRVARLTFPTRENIDCWVIFWDFATKCFSSCIKSPWVFRPDLRFEKSK